jgi:PIN domain nuclease of toxin-antitoxin system
VRLLLDSHVFLWWITDDRRLTQKARRALSSTSNECFLSHASVWEMAIKTSLGKLQLDRPVGRFVEEQCELNGFSLLAISFRHLVAVESLPWHHRDPFDRLLVAQAMEDGLALVTGDKSVAAYGVKTIA